MWTQRDQFSNNQIPLTDQSLIQRQYELRKSNHSYSEITKAPSRALPESPHSEVGDLVYLYNDRNKTCARDRYLVVSTDNSWCNIRKFVGSQLRNTSYRVKRSDCYKVPSLLNTLRQQDTYSYDNFTSSDEDDNTGKPQSPPKPPDIPNVISIPHLQEGTDSQVSWPSWDNKWGGGGGRLLQSCFSDSLHNQPNSNVHHEKNILSVRSEDVNKLKSDISNEVFSAFDISMGNLMSTYIATVPKEIKAGSDAKLCISALKGGVKRVTIFVMLQDKQNRTLTKAKAQRSLLQRPVVVTIKVPGKTPPGYDYKIRVRVIGDIKFDKTAIEIRVTEKASSIFIQTDKAIYKPGDLVQFRVVGTNQRLKVLRYPLTIYIQDPKNNRVKQFLNVRPVFGVFAGTFQLSTLTNLGRWTITVEQKRGKKSKRFDVQRVVLPKFEVNVVLPPFELKTDRFFTVTVNALYTFGKPVDGDAELIIKSQWNSEVQIIKKFKINGKATIKVLMSDVVPKLGTYITVIAKVNETITGISVNDTGDVVIYDTDEELTFSSSMLNVFKPGLYYTIMLKARRRDGSNLESILDSVNITVKYTVPGTKKQPKWSPTGGNNQVMPFGRFSQRINEDTKVLWTRVEQIPQSGIIELSARFPKAALSGSFEAFYRKERTSKYLSRAESPSRNFIKVSVKDNRNAKPGRRLPLIIRCTEIIRFCSYKVFSQRSLITQGRFRMRNRKQQVQNLRITYAMIPHAKLLVYYVRRKNGEVVADAITIPIEDIFENEVSIKFNKRRAKPGDEVQVELTADPHSLVNVLAVDKSVLLLKSGNDITTQDGAGVYVLTDALLYQYIPPPSRKYAMFSDGKATIITTAPDTITEWIASAFAVNPRSGLGVASNTANLTTFQRFFMRFELPYSAIRGEVIIVQATVFNYLDQDLQVSVKLANNVNFTFVDANGNDFNPGPNGWTKSLLVKEDSVASVYFPLKPRALGKILLDGTARSTIGADALQREFLIEAEGIKQNCNVPLIIDLRQGGRVRETISLSFPPNLVEDSEFIKIQVIGDLLGATLAGLEDLLQISYGCGEQNMIRFAPNVYVSSYLKTTNRLTNDVRNRVESILEGGYQRELSYVHDDGSFSAFGNNDKSGTTWLTAFVIKSFSQAVSFTYIDINVITKAVQWIIKQQETSGAFNEPGIVLHKEMQGGSVSSKRSLTAFVLIALLEARDINLVAKEVQKSVTDSINKAVTFVAKSAPASIANLYELAISFYALSLAKHSIASQILAELEKQAKVNGSEKYWTLPETEADKLQPWKTWRPPQTKVRAIDVEMTSYILLGYNLKDDTDNGIRIMKWLGRQRNPRGGFISTQDTVIAIQALSGLGEKIYVPNFQMSVNTVGDTWTQGKTFDVNNRNALVLQIEDIPNTVRSVSVNANGKGLCLMEVAVYFNVNNDLREPAFALTTTVLNDSTKGFRLRVCFNWLRGGQSTMGILEISLPSGMEADLDSIDTTNTGGQYKKVEKAFRQINLYFDTILSEQMCIEVDIRRVALVARHKPVWVKLREYYEPSNEVVKFYQSKALANATIIEVCGPNNCEEVKRR
ncbi:CD109 antigen-like [Mytilus trossulus]|uniref:CD109 antigen-like n=1 Tax=Mytilus trossulus TaxID=6551 RepID=UPI003006F7D8